MEKEKVKKTFLEWIFDTHCHICFKTTDEDFVCKICDKYYCEDCSVVYNQFTQVDYNCCKNCK